MSSFAIRNPYFIVVVCLIIAVVGVTSLARMPVDMFPSMNIPVVVVATFYSGMPPEQIETDITSRFERFFTLGSRHRTHRIALAARRQRDQSLLPARHQSRFRRHHHLESRDGAIAPSASRHAAAGRPEVRRLQSSGLPGDLQGRRPERDLSCATWPSSRSATRSPAFPAPACRSPSAASTARSWCTPIPTSWKPTS